MAEKSCMANEWGLGILARHKEEHAREFTSNHPYYTFYFPVCIPFFLYLSPSPPVCHFCLSSLFFHLPSSSSSHFPTAAGSHRLLAIAFDELDELTWRQCLSDLCLQVPHSSFLVFSRFCTKQPKTAPFSSLGAITYARNKERLVVFKIKFFFSTFSRW